MVKGVREQHGIFSNNQFGIALSEFFCDDRSLSEDRKP